MPVAGEAISPHDFEIRSTEDTHYPGGSGGLMIPYDKLYIYEIDGRVPGGERGFPPDYIGTWWEGDHVYLFFSREKETFIHAILKRNPSLHLIDRFAMSYRDWQGGEEIGPFRIGQMVFAPPWDQVTLSPGDVLIRLDPSVVFGNGLHPTTQGCIHALLRVYQKDRPKTVLDLGTGTGILALTCAKLGSERIVAVDYNPLAIKTAKKNVALNHEEKHIDVVEGEAETFVRKTADVICCNLHFPVLTRLLESHAFFDKRWCVLSGFFPSEAKGIVRSLQTRKFRLVLFSPNGPWQTILGFNPMSPM